ncbi:M42 family metallopeptidase [Planomicrobium sp. YIM 101495]|uniref:M42 family metallopeptidase n=1 Tax=Planomicrobium sp. YIM 101495 TaxID=2665160 RepID=UPI0012B70A98|nr:M42 family metallopeptidase [Planomicrobium sp. YIM 101495]MTD30425.1 M20/M25/M40 family metallo-hydrolase [Planomicrobium sp. YIM 101495]
MTVKWNEQETIAVLKRLVETPSPSGYTMEIMKAINEQFADWNVTAKMTNKGSVIATIPGSNDEQHRLLTAHVDTLGAMVKDIKPNGRIKLSLVGGFTFNAIEGENCLVHTADGKQVSGTIVLHNTTVHVYKDAGSSERNANTMEIRLDEKAFTADAVREIGIEVGDFVSFNPRFTEAGSGYIKSRHLDDKASTALLLRLVEQLSKSGEEIPYTTHFYISNNEEIGFGGNSSIPEETIEYIAVDMGAIGDGQASDEYTVSICAKDSSGPYHYGLTRHLVGLAKDQDIDYKVDIYPYYGSDASAAIRAGYDVKHALFGPGIEASHSYERTHMDSLKATAELLYAYVKSPLAP